MQYIPPTDVVWLVQVSLRDLNENSSRAQAYGFEVLRGVGGGILFVTAYFPVLAPIHVEQSATALAFFTFVRGFAQLTYQHTLFSPLVISNNCSLCDCRYGVLL